MDLRLYFLIKPRSNIGGDCATSGFLNQFKRLSKWALFWTTWHLRYQPSQIAYKIHENSACNTHLPLCLILTTQLFYQLSVISICLQHLLLDWFTWHTCSSFTAHTFQSLKSICQIFGSKSSRTFLWFLQDNYMGSNILLISKLLVSKHYLIGCQKMLI